MADPLVVEFFGTPASKLRDRSVRIGDRTIHYTPTKTRKYEAALTWAVREALAREPRLLGPVSLSVIATVPIPTSWSLKKQTLARSGKLWPTTKPDVDNYYKLAADACNAVAYNDDKQVCFATISKRYGDRPSIRIELASLGGDGGNGE